MKNRKINRKSQKKTFNDLLLPILCVLCLMPFCVYLAEYDYGYSNYLWHSDNSVVQDLYAYYRSYFFELVTMISLGVLILRMALYREKNKSIKIFLPLAVYCIFAVLSTIFSINPRASFTGNFYQFQSIFVLLGFCLMSFYTYQILETEQDYQTIRKGVIIVFLLISITGWFQVFGHDLLNFEWVQRLVMSEEQFAEYRGTIGDAFSGNNVFLTLYNPNYAAVFLVMFVAVFAVLSYSEQEKKKKICYLLLLFAALLLLWFTYTRAALVAMGTGGIVFIFCIRKTFFKRWKYILSGIMVFLVVCVSLDAINGFPYFSRMIETPKKSKIQEILTSQKGISITYDDKSLTLILDNTGLSARDTKGNTVTLEQNSNGEWKIPFGTSVSARFMTRDETLSCVLQLEEGSLEFVKTEEGYFYRNGDGKLDKIVEIPKLDLHGLEYLGSGRLYIWSRVIPVLKDYILVGSGPDTFAEAFPQNDYVGKLIYAENSRRVIESAHNDYLTRWVQTGFLSFLALLIFYLWFFKHCFSFYRNCDLQTNKQQLGFGCFVACICYLTCCFFSDSSLYTTPTFYIFAGIALASSAN